MSMYLCEGIIKEVTVENGKVSFKLEPTAPYLFERKNDDGTIERCLLFVENTPKLEAARIVGPSQEFIPPMPSDLNTLLIAKANRLKIHIETALKCTLSQVREITII